MSKKLRDFEYEKCRYRFNIRYGRLKKQCYDVKCPICKNTIDKDYAMAIAVSNEL